MPSVAIWAMLEEILEFSYTAAFPRLAWVYSSFSLFKKKTGQKTLGRQMGDALPPVPSFHVDFLVFFASLCPHECTNNANQQSCKCVQSYIGAKFDVQLLIVLTFYLFSFFQFLFLIYFHEFVVVFFKERVLAGRITYLFIYNSCGFPRLASTAADPPVFHSGLPSMSVLCPSPGP